MRHDKSPIFLNILLAGVLGFAIYLGLMYMESQDSQSTEIKARQVVQPEPAKELPQEPSAPSPLPSAPLFIRDDLAQLINESPQIRDVFKGYKAVGLDLGDATYTMMLQDDGSLQEVIRGIQPGVDFTMKTSPDAFRRLNLLVKHGNLLGIVQRINEMEFDPPQAKKEFINKLHAAQGFTSKLQS